MATYHYVPKGDAIRHKTLGHGCECCPDVKSYNNDESRDGFDVYVMHHEITLEMAVMQTPAVKEVA